MIKRTKSPRAKPAAPGRAGRAQQYANAAQEIHWGNSIWSHRRQVALKFASEADYDAAIDCLWEDETLDGMPRVHVGDDTMIVPATAVPVLEQKGLRFTKGKVISAGELPPATINELRRFGRVPT